MGLMKASCPYSLWCFEVNNYKAPSSSLSDARQDRSAWLTKASVFKPDLVSIFVGPDRHLFKAHKDLLCLRSPFFSKCLDGRSGFQEALGNCVELPEDDPEAFALVVKWIYTLVVTIPSDRSHEPENVSDQPAHTSPEDNVELLIATYILADELCMEKLVNDIVDAVRRWHKTEDTAVRFLSTLHQHGLYDSQMNSFLKEQLAWNLQSAARMEGPFTFRGELGNLLKEGGDVVSKVIVDALKLDESSPEPSYSKEVCRWHSHQRTERCKKEAYK